MKEYSFIFDILGVIIGVIGSGIFAVLVFYIGTEYEKRKDKKKEHKNLQDRLFHFKNLIQRLVENIEKNINHYNEFIDKVEKNPIESHHLHRKASSDINRILSIPSEDILNALHSKFQNQSAIKIHDDLFSNLDYVKIEEKMTPKLLKFQMREIYKIRIDVKNLLDSLLEYCARVIHNIRANNPKSFRIDPLYKIIELKLRSYSPSLDENIIFDYHFINFINPLKNELLKSVEIYTRDEAVDILQYTRKLSMMRADIRVKSEYFADELKETTSKLKSAKIRLQKELKNL